jgi:peptidoglycan/LPS O-acetylase OafA/YrhL
MSITVLALNVIFTVYIVFLMYLIPKVEPPANKWGLVALICAIAVVWVSIMSDGGPTSDTCSRVLHYSTSRL